MITDDQLTALAREYAEEMCTHMEDDFIKDEAIRDNMLAFQMAVNRLSQLYCLVEKSKLIEEYKTYSSLRDNNSLLSLNIALVTRHDRGVDGIRVLKSLFPEIEKEVEE